MNFVHIQQRVIIDGRNSCVHRLRRHIFLFFCRKRILFVQHQQIRQIITGILKPFLRHSCTAFDIPRLAKSPWYSGLLVGMPHSLVCLPEALTCLRGTVPGITEIKVSSNLYRTNSNLARHPSQHWQHARLPGAPRRDLRLCP